jgi:hypothetical protein
VPYVQHIEEKGRARYAAACAQERLRIAVHEDPTFGFRVECVFDLRLIMERVRPLEGDPGGQYEAWIASIPEPGPALLVTLGVLGLAASLRRCSN